MGCINLRLHVSSLRSTSLLLSLSLWCWSHGKGTWCCSLCGCHSTRLDTLRVSCCGCFGILLLCSLLLSVCCLSLLNALCSTTSISITISSRLLYLRYMSISKLLRSGIQLLLCVLEYIVMELTAQVGNCSLIWNRCCHSISLEV